MSIGKSLIGSIVGVAIFAVAYTYFFTSIVVAIEGAVDLQSYLDLLPVSVGTTTVIMAVVGFICGIIGGLIAGRESIATTVLLTAIFSLIVAVGNLLNLTIGLESLITGFDPQLLADLLPGLTMTALETYVGGIVGLVIGTILGPTVLIRKK
jgi:hypothetical protein